MEEQRVTIVARIKAKEGMEDRVKKGLLALLAPTRSEAGCIGYDLHQSAKDARVFMFYENWKSKEALDEHMKMPHFKAFAEKAGELLAEPLDITFWKIVG